MAGGQRKGSIDASPTAKRRRADSTAGFEDGSAVSGGDMDMHVDLHHPAMDDDLTQLGVPQSVGGTKLFAPSLHSDTSSDILASVGGGVDGDTFSSLPYAGAAIPTPTKPSGKRKRDGSDGEMSDDDDGTGISEPVVLLEVAQRAVKVGGDQGLLLLQESSFMAPVKGKRKKNMLQRSAQYSTLASRKCRGEAKNALLFCERIFKDDDAIASHLTQLSPKQRAAASRLIFSILVRASIVESKGDFQRDLFAEADNNGWVDQLGQIKDCKLPTVAGMEWSWKTKELLEFARGCLDPRFHDQHSSHRKFKFFPHLNFKDAVPAIRAATRLAIVKVLGVGQTSAAASAASAASTSPTPSAATVSAAAVSAPAAAAPAGAAAPAADGSAPRKQPVSAQDDANVAMVRARITNIFARLTHFRR